MNAAREKVEAEGACRICLDEVVDHLDAAHVVPRSVVPQGFDEPDGVVPLCSTIKGGGGCHDEVDAHRLDLLPHLTLDEQAAAVRKVGIEAARRQLAPSAYKAQAEVQAEEWTTCDWPGCSCIAGPCVVPA